MVYRSHFGEQSEGAVLARLQDGGAVSIWGVSLHPAHRCFLSLTVATRIPPSTMSRLHAQREKLLRSASIANLEALSQQAKRRHLRGRPHWTLNLIARDPSYHGPLVTGRIVDPFIERARKRTMPRVPQIGISGRGELKVGEGRCDGSVDLVHCENPKIIKEWF